MAAGSYQGRRGLQTRNPQAIPWTDSIPSILKVFDSLSSEHVVGLVTIASHDGLTDAKRMVDSSASCYFTFDRPR